MIERIFLNTARRLAALSGLAVVLFPILFCTSAALGQRSVLTYHYDNFRTGQNTQETILRPGNVNANGFRWLFAHPVDGQIYAQPLYVPNLNIPGKGIHNVVFVATEGDTVYAFDADSRAASVRGPLWSASLIDTAHGAAAGATTVSTSGSNPDINCGDLIPSVGITSTPVIDPATGTIYVEAKSKENGGFVHRLHALDITTGNEKPMGPVVITGYPGTGGPTFDPLLQMNRPGLLLSNGKVYVAFASHCDTPLYHGWVFSYDAATLAQTGIFVTTPNLFVQRPPNGVPGAGGIWMSGAGLASDGANVFAATGNGDFDNATDFGDSILKLSGASLGLLDYFTPFNQDNLNSKDLDVGSGGVLLLPDQSGSHRHLLVQAGKKGTIYSVDRDQMGEYSTGSNQIVQQLTGAVGPVFGMPAYWNNTVYFWGAGDKLKAFSLNNGQLSTSPIATSAESYGFPGANLSISANGNTNGIVWSLRTDAYNSGPPGAEGSAVLQAHDAVSLALLYSSDWNPGRDAPGPAVKFTVPVVANGKVYVGTDSYLSVYGLVAPPPPSTLNATVSVSVPASMVAGQQYTATFTVTNTGTSDWNSVGPYCPAFRLASQNPVSNTTWGTARFELPGTVSAGASVTFSGVVTAPATPGVYNFQWQMVEECVTLVGSPSTNVSIAVNAPAGAQNATVSASVPATMVSGHQYTATFTVTNTGTLSWNLVGPQCNAYRLGALNPTDNTNWGSRRIELPSTIAAGASLTFSTTITAPATAGTYNFQWAMMEECLTWFGSASPNITVTVTAPQFQGLNAWFVVGASGANMDADDTAVMNHLTSVGFSVTPVYWGGTTSPPNLSGISLVVLSSSSDPAGDGAFVGEGVPLLVYKGSAYPNLNMTKPAADYFWGRSAGQSQVSIVNPTSPLAAGLSGTVTVTAAPSYFTWGAPNESAIAVASLAGAPGYDTIFAYPKWSSMIYGYTAPACRVGFFFGDGGPSTATTNAWSLFDASLSWLTTSACE